MILSTWQRKTGPMALTGGILTLIGAIFIITAILLTSFQLIVMSNTVPAQGTIITCADSERSCQPIVRFRTPAGRQITFQSSWSSSFFQPDETVPVRYHPDEPQNAQVDLWLVNRFLSPAFGGVGLILLLSGLLLLWRAKGHPAIHIIDQYYTAIGNRKYGTAFGYLHPTMKTREGRPITLEWFEQRARAYDATSGTVSRATITRFSLAANRVHIVMKISRGAQAYKVHLNLARQGDTWKITGFDLF